VVFQGLGARETPKAKQNKNYSVCLLLFIYVVLHTFELLLEDYTQRSAHSFLYDVFGGGCVVFANPR
jgi:hypothetical protein